MPLILDGTLGVSGVDGSAGTPSLQGTDSNTGVFYATDIVGIATNGTERMRIDSSGRVLVGSSTAPSGAGVKLNLYGGSGSTTTAGLQLTFSGSPFGGGAITSSNSGGGMEFYTFTGNVGSESYSERMRIDSSGNVGIGTSSPSSRLHVATSSAEIARFASSATNGGYQIFYPDNNITPVYIGSQKAILATGNAADFAIVGTGANNIVFGTNSTERMRITSGGDVLIGRNSDLGAGARVNIESANNEADILAMRYFNAGAGKYWRHLIDSANGYLLVNNGGTGVTIADGGTSWSAYSDERLKTDLKPIENAVNKVNTLRAVTGRYKTDEEDKSRSFLIAQDVQNVLPEAVSTFKQVKSEDETEYLSLAYTEVIPLLVAAIKEQQVQIEELKQEVAKLKGV